MPLFFSRLVLVLFTTYFMYLLVTSQRDEGIISTTHTHTQQRTNCCAEKKAFSFACCSTTTLGNRRRNPHSLEEATGVSLSCTGGQKGEPSHQLHSPKRLSLEVEAATLLGGGWLVGAAVLLSNALYPSSVFALLSSFRPPEQRRGLAHAVHHGQPQGLPATGRCGRGYRSQVGV